ncbi:hypothetical protein IBX76_02545 [Neisseria gonorrhoeae]|uniref:hypothetical protein n=1 Tax=Neisseria gonorrhoeae TaxID=485 RepID=UPI00178687A9|nr:hypothetical protein [Neisseria gonorrhoeae]QOG38340.1 hypothetical protein IBX76_02545 [Neisseria gonorrhoeae]
MNNSVQISNTSIHQTEIGLFRLNDLDRASGGEDRRARLKAAANALEALSAHADAEHAEKIRPILPEIRNLSAV